MNDAFGGVRISTQGTTGDKFTADQVNALHYCLGEFEIVLKKELSDMPIFVVEEKGNFSLLKLVKGASTGYPEATTDKLTTECKTEIDESGKCLAFLRATASGFHIMRAVELVVKQFITRSELPMPPLERCNWGEYIAVLRKGSAPKKITDLLQVLKDNYRNPIML